MIIKRTEIRWSWRSVKTKDIQWNVLQIYWQMILEEVQINWTNDWTFKKMQANNLSITIQTWRFQREVLIEHLWIPVRIYWWSIMTIVSIETAIVMKCSFITETDILKKIWILLQYTESSPTKLNSLQSFSLNSYMKLM